jgi:hypothetical protein
MKLGLWRRGPGLELHETTVRENAIDETVLPDLTEDHLRELGLPMGARRGGVGARTQLLLLLADLAPSLFG